MRIFIIIFCFLPCLLFGQNYQVENELNVNARSGLNMKNTPGVEGSKIGFLEYGEKVKVISKEFTSQRDTFDNLDGGWVEIEKGKISGYVFDGYLTKLPVVKIDSKDTHWSICLFDEMNKYATNNFKNAPETTYDNGNDGEGAHSMKILTSIKGYQYVEHGYTDCIAREFQIPNLRQPEGILFVKSFFKNCNLLSVEIENKIEKGGRQILFEDDTTGILNLKWLENRMFFIIASSI